MWRNARGYLAGGLAAVTVIGAVFWALREAGVRPRAETAPPPSPTGRWQVLPKAFPVTSDWRTGPRLILPGRTACYVALGQDATGTGMRQVTWRAVGDCTRPVSLTPTRPPVGDGPPSQDEVTVLAGVPVTGGAGYLVLGRRTFRGDAYAYDTRILRGDPEGGEAWRTVADLFTPGPTEGHVGPHAIAASGTAYVAVGQRDGATTAWRSTTGTTWQEQRLPASPGGAEVALTAVAAAPDGRFVALGSAKSAAGPPQNVALVSTDHGVTWRAVEVTDPGQAYAVRAVVHDGHQFIGVGGTSGDQRSAAVVLVSADGAVWRRIEVPGAAYLQTAVALPDGTLLAVAADGPHTTRLDEVCARAWRWDGEAWTSEAIGCHGVPDSLAVLPDGRVAGVHWSALFLRSSP